MNFKDLAFTLKKVLHRFVCLSTPLGKARMDQKTHQNQWFWWVYGTVT